MSLSPLLQKYIKILLNAFHAPFEDNTSQPQCLDAGHETIDHMMPMKEKGEELMYETPSNGNAKPSSLSHVWLK